MKRISAQIFIVTASVFLFFYGLFYHIGTSEFWPLTASKTLFNSDPLEYSLFQKPLFSFFLSLFHFIPLSDVTHILLVKIFFSVLGVIGLFLFSYYLYLKTQNKLAFVIVFLLSLANPLFLQNFFRIRSDQASFVLFCALLVLGLKSNRLAFLGFLIILSLTSFKSVLFIIPLVFVFHRQILFQFHRLKISQKFFLIGFALGLLIWVISLNLNSFLYLFEVIKNNFLDFSILRFSIQDIWPLLLFNVAALVWHFQNVKWDRPSLWISAYCLFCVALSPQAYPFYVASLIQLLLLPTYVFFLSPQVSQKVRLITLGLLILIQTTFYIYRIETQNEKYYSSNFAQLKYIRVVGKLASDHDLTYLDSAGILPRPRFITCLASPHDEIANQSCLHKVTNHEAESYIITQRLAFLGEPLFAALKKDYTQIKPNFWVKNNYLVNIKPEEIDLQSLELPMVIFGGD